MFLKYFKISVPEALSADNRGGDGEGNCKNNDDFCLPGLECDKDRCPISKGYAESIDCCMGSCDSTKHTCLVKATPGGDGEGICTFDKVRRSQYSKNLKKVHFSDSRTVCVKHFFFVIFLDGAAPNPKKHVRRGHP